MPQYNMPNVDNVYLLCSEMLFFGNMFYFTISTNQYFNYRINSS